MMPMGGQEGVDIDAAAQGAMQKGVNPAVLGRMLDGYSSTMEDLDNAEDYEAVMNGIRGDQVPVAARYAELAGIVGQEDAQATPESVLTMLQPVMMMSAVDQGIGGLAQDEMSLPVEGPLAEGIMSTVDMGAPEGPAPVNFSQGGAVRYMADGGTSSDPAPIGGRQGAIFREQQALYQSLLDPASEAADLEEQKELTQAQMLFDIAQGGLAFATPGDRQMSPAERLAESFTPVLGNIGARAGEFGKFKQAQKAQTKQMDMAALQAASTQIAAEREADAARGRVKPGDLHEIRNAAGELLWEGLLATQSQAEALREQFPNGTLVKSTPPSDEVQNFLTPGGKVVPYRKGSPGWREAIRMNWPATGDASQAGSAPTERITLYNPLTKETVNPLKGDPSVTRLLEEGFIVVNTQSVPTEPRLSASISYLTNPVRLGKYASGTLGEQTAEFEQVVLAHIQAGDRYWNGKEYVEGAKGQLAGQVLAAIKEGNPTFYERITSGGAATPGSSTDENEATSNLNDATLELFNPDGTVNRASKAWGWTKPNRYDPTLDYRVVIGASSVFPNIGRLFSEGSAEVFGGGASPFAQKLAKAGTSLDAFANDLLQFATQRERRVLKFVQEKIEKEVKGIRPGGLFLKTDADASASFDTLTDTMAQQMQIAASILPEYGGKIGSYTAAQVTQTREDMNEMKVLMNELLAFEKGFAFAPTPRTAAVSGQDQRLPTAREQINSMRKKLTPGGG